ncbi:g364 [Yersinia phage phiR1-37]|uniref:hypothetical protein n=1 Tax=Yersinia phage phiR1-37 TaxID=331278 RepID=UPI00022DBE17|nr:hypothetical protein phiR1-37_gp364 [Yersinia phage phiR1-37]CCE26387.1 g364 [Yersinia phage phiR1-37]
MYISRTNEREMNFKRKSNPKTVREIYTNLLHDDFSLPKYKMYFGFENELKFSNVTIMFKYVKRPFHSLQTIFDVNVEMSNRWKSPKVSAVIQDDSLS